MYCQTGEKARTVQYFLFTDWDAGNDVPSSPGTFVAFVEEVKAACSDGPILLHCRFVVTGVNHMPSVLTISLYVLIGSYGS